MNHEESEKEIDEAAGNKVGEAIMKFIGSIPETSEAVSEHPAVRARSIANLASAKAATTAGALALPPGPLAWITILPELIAIWRIQAQMVADLAGTFGRTESLSSNQMIYCLFRHGAAMAVRDLVVRVGDRYLVKQVTQRALQHVAEKIGIKVTQKAIGKSVTRLLPVIGALGVGGYAFYDTAQVAKTAIAMFESDMELDGE